MQLEMILIGKMVYLFNFLALALALALARL